MKKKGYNITLGIFIGLIAGVIVGIIMPEWANTALSVVASIYMSALKMMIFSLVFTSLVMGIIGIGDIAKTGKVGLHALLWYTGTTALASGLGLVLPRLLHLGKNAHIVATKTQVEAATFNGLLDTLQNIIPSNPVEAFATGNMLQVLAFAVIIGLACLAIKEKADPFVNLCDSIWSIRMYCHSYVFKWCGYNASIRTSIVGFIYYVLFICIYCLWWYG